jgi:hypothetical protein
MHGKTPSPGVRNTGPTGSNRWRGERFGKKTRGKKPIKAQQIMKADISSTDPRTLLPRAPDSVLVFRVSWNRRDPQRKFGISPNLPIFSGNFRYACAVCSSVVCHVNSHAEGKSDQILSNNFLFQP